MDLTRLDRSEKRINKNIHIEDHRRTFAQNQRTVNEINTQLESIVPSVLSKTLHLTTLNDQLTLIKEKVVTRAACVADTTPLLALQKAVIEMKKEVIHLNEKVAISSSHVWRNHPKYPQKNWTLLSDDPEEEDVVIEDNNHE